MLARSPRSDSRSARTRRKSSEASSRSFWVSLALSSARPFADSSCPLASERRPTRASRSSLERSKSLQRAANCSAGSWRCRSSSCAFAKASACCAAASAAEVSRSSAATSASRASASTARRSLAALGSRDNSRTCRRRSRSSCVSEAPCNGSAERARPGDGPGNGRLPGDSPREASGRGDAGGQAQGSRAQGRGEPERGGLGHSAGLGPTASLDAALRSTTGRGAQAASRQRVVVAAGACARGPCGVGTQRPAGASTSGRGPLSTARFSTMAGDGQRTAQRPAASA
mmetsp:Transcript_20972/g.59462  ORF Transcript_20972/g.59462 Transcript_20972/m.59462 type:complete len:286 (-) Transcript_20972:30-887(-)